MPQQRKFGNYRFSPHQAAALVLVATGSMPNRRLYLGALNASRVLGLKTRLNRRQWKRILDRFLELGLIECKPLPCGCCGVVDLTYGLTEIGMDVYDPHRSEMNRYLSETLPWS